MCLIEVNHILQCELYIDIRALCIHFGKAINSSKINHELLIYVLPNNDSVNPKELFHSTRAHRARNCNKCIHLYFIFLYFVQKKIKLITNALIKNNIHVNLIQTPSVWLELNSRVTAWPYRDMARGRQICIDFKQNAGPLFGYGILFCELLYCIRSCIVRISTRYLFCKTWFCNFQYPFSYYHTLKQKPYGWLRCKQQHISINNNVFPDFHDVI